MAAPSGGSFVGLDIGTQTIKAVEVKGKGGSLQVSAMGIENTPPGAVQGGMVMDPKALGVAIKDLLKKSGIRTGKSVSAAAGQSVVVRVIEVPKMTPVELKETMKWEVERHIPFAANDVEMDYQPIEDAANAANADSPNMEVLLAVAQRDMVGQHLETLQAAGLTPTAIDIEPLAVGRALIDLSKTGLQAKNVVIVNMGASQTDVGIFKQGALRFPRTIPMAGDNFTRAISDTLGVPMEQAEDEKREHAEVLMDLVGNPGDPFGGGFGEPEPAASVGGNPFDFGDLPPVFTASLTPDAVVPPTSGPLPFEMQGVPPTSGPLPFEQGAMPVASPFDTPAGGATPPGIGGNTFDFSDQFPPTNPPAATGDNPFAATTSGGAVAYDNPFGDTPVAASGAVTGDNPFGDQPAGVPAAPPATIPVDDIRTKRRREIFDALLPILGEFSMELRRSIDYFRSRYPEEAVDQIILCGGSARIKNLDVFLQQDLGIPTMVANPFGNLLMNSKQISGDRIADLSPSYAVAVGLATRDAVLGSGK